MPNCYPFLCCNSVLLQLYLKAFVVYLIFWQNVPQKRSEYQMFAFTGAGPSHLETWLLGRNIFPVMKMSNFVFRTSSDNSLRLTKYGVNALASWETIPPSFLQFGSIWVIHTHTYLCAFLVGHITLFWTILPLTMTKYPKDVKRGSQFIALCKANESKAKRCATLIFIVV